MRNFDQIFKTKFTFNLPNLNNIVRLRPCLVRTKILTMYFQIDHNKCKQCFLVTFISFDLFNFLKVKFSIQMLQKICTFNTTKSATMAQIFAMSCQKTYDFQLPRQDNSLLATIVSAWTKFLFFKTKFAMNVPNLNTSLVRPGTS